MRNNNNRNSKKNASWRRSSKKQNNNNNDNDHNQDDVLSFSNPEIKDTLLIPDQIRRFIISKVESSLFSLTWKDPTPILWNQFQKELCPSNDDDTSSSSINIQIGFVIFSSDHNDDNDDVFKHGLRNDGFDNYFFTTNITTASSKLQQQQQSSSSSSSSDILVVLFDHTTTSINATTTTTTTTASSPKKKSGTPKKKNRKLLLSSLSRKNINNNNLLLPIGILQQQQQQQQQQQVSSTLLLVDGKKRREELELEFYEKMIGTLKQQVKQIRTKNIILKALHEEDSSDTDHNILKALLVLPGSIKKASNYYKKSCRSKRRGRKITKEMKREISHHVYTKLFSLQIEDTMIQKRYFPKLPPPYSWRVDDDTITTPRNIKELEERIQRIRIILYPLLALQKKRQMEVEAELKGGGEEGKKEENDFSFLSYYDHDQSNCNNDDDFDDFLLKEDSHNNQRTTTTTNNRWSSSRQRRRYSNESDFDDTNNREDTGGIIKFRNNGIQFVSNFWNILSNIGMYLPMIIRSSQQHRQLQQDGTNNNNNENNDFYNEINDDNHYSDKEEEDTVHDFLGLASLSSSAPTSTSTALCIGEDDTIVRIPSDDGDALLLESILQYSSGTTTTTAAATFSSESASKYLQLYLSNNKKLLRSSSHSNNRTKDNHNMVNIMSEGGTINSIPASSVTIGDALVVILKHNNNQTEQC